MYMWNIRSPKTCESGFLQMGSQTQANLDGKSDEYQEKFVVCGNWDDAGLSCTFAPVVYYSVIRLVLSIAVQAKCEVHQIDYSNAFI